MKTQIKPRASFNLTDPDQQKQCFHYRNMQPLWAKDNRDKWFNIPHEHQTSLPI